MTPPVPFLITPPAITSNMSPEGSQFYKNNLNVATIGSSEPPMHMEQEIDAFSEDINIAFEKFAEIFDDLTVNKSVLKIIAKKWFDDMLNYSDQADAIPNDYLKAAFLMHRVSQLKPIPTTGKPVMMNEVFALHLGFNTTGIDISQVSSDLYRKFLLHLYFDDPEPLEIARLLKRLRQFEDDYDWVNVMINGGSYIDELPNGKELLKIIIGD